MADTQTMAQHFLLTSAARTLSLASVARMSDEEAERVFIRLRWANNDGNAPIARTAAAQSSIPAQRLGAAEAH